MPAIIVADTFLKRYDNELTAAVTVVVMLAVVVLVHRALRRVTRRTAALAGGRLNPVLDTRLRFLRHTIDAIIVLIGVAIALSQFTALDRVAGTVLASSAIAAAVVGFAARQTLANVVAGLMLALTQPLRIGDVVTFEGETGTVEDVRLTYTWLRTASEARLIIPNERLAGGVLRNDSIVSPQVAVEVSLWIGHDDDETAALAALRDSLPGATVRLAEVTAEGTRLLVRSTPTTVHERAAAESELRAAGLRVLREAGLRERA
jgi:small-conductance mechanosensitive channel